MNRGGRYSQGNMNVINPYHVNVYPYLCLLYKYYYPGYTVDVIESRTHPYKFSEFHIRVFLGDAEFIDDNPNK